MILYLDLFFLINVMMDGLLLFGVKRVLKRETEWFWIAAAAGAGGIWACVIILSGTGPVGRIGSSLAGAVGMVYLAFRPKRMSELFRCVLTFLLFCGAAAGGCEFLGMERDWSFAAGVSLFAGISLFLSAAFNYLKRERTVKEKQYQVTIFYGEKQAVVTAFWDTGNQLYEPYGHQPVHVITKRAANRLGDCEERAVCIPFSAVGTKRGLLPGIRVSKMEIRREGRLIRQIERPWLAVSGEELSGNHGYEMLLHGEIFNEEERKT